MREVLFLDDVRLELHGLGSAERPPRDSLDPVRSMSLIRRASLAAGAMSVMRRALLGVRPGLVLGHRSDDEVVEELCRLVASRWVRVFVEAKPRLFTTGDEGESEAAPAASPAPARELHWVSFQLLLDDDTPLSNEPFRAELCDGRVIEGRLDGAGRVRFHDLASAGDNKIEFPNIDARFHISSSDEDPSKRARGSMRDESADGIPYSPGGRAAPVPADDDYVYRLPGWAPIRMLADDEEAIVPVTDDGPVAEEPITDGDEGWDPIAVYLDVDLDEDRPPELLSS